MFLLFSIHLGNLVIDKLQCKYIIFIIFDTANFTNFFALGLLHECYIFRTSKVL
jgi:hypothetical protein